MCLSYEKKTGLMVENKRLLGFITSHVDDKVSNIFDDFKCSKHFLGAVTVKFLWSLWMYP